MDQSVKFCKYVCKNGVEKFNLVQKAIHLKQNQNRTRWAQELPKSVTILQLKPCQNCPTTPDFGKQSVKHIFNSL